MTGAYPDDPDRTERFDTGGRVTGWIGLVASLGVIAVWWAPAGDRLPLWVLSGAVLSGLLFWSSILRPSVSAVDDTLVLRNMFEDVRIPLAAVEEHAVRQVLAVRAGDKRYVGTGVGRSFASAKVGGARGGRDDAGGHTRGIHPADYVETRIAGLASDARDRAGIRHRSEEQAAMGISGVERRPTWLVIVAMGLALLALVSSIVLV